MNKKGIGVSQIVELQKSYEMMRQRLQIYQKTRNKIPYLLILISWTPLDAEKSYGRETAQKIDFTGFEIAWVHVKSKFSRTLRISSRAQTYYQPHDRSDQAFDKLLENYIFDFRR